VSALLDESIKLVWEDITYQAKAGFCESELFNGEEHPDLEISWVAVVPQVNCRGCIILNLSATINVHEKPTSDCQYHKKQHKGKYTQPSVNDTTKPTDDQASVLALGTTMNSILHFMFDTDCKWEINWHKIDLSDGFWQMIVEEGKQWYFVYQLPVRPGDTEHHYVVPSSLQMGWKNSPAYFCTTTEATYTLIQCILALTMNIGIAIPHRHEKFLFKFTPSKSGEILEDDTAEPPASGPQPPASGVQQWETPRNVSILSCMFVDNFMNGIARPHNRKHQCNEQKWVGCTVLVFTLSFLCPACSSMRMVVTAFPNGSF